MSARPRPMALPCDSGSGRARRCPDGGPAICHRAVDSAAHDVGVHAGAADLLADLVDDQQIDFLERQPATSPGLDEQLLFARLEISGATPSMSAVCPSRLHQRDAKSAALDEHDRETPRTTSWCPGVVGVVALRALRLPRPINILIKPLSGPGSRVRLDAANTRRGPPRACGSTRDGNPSPCCPKSTSIVPRWGRRRLLGYAVACRISR